MPRTMIAAVALTTAVMTTPAPNTMTQPEPMAATPTVRQTDSTIPAADTAPRPVPANLTAVPEAATIPPAVAQDLAAFGASQGWGDPEQLRVWISDLNGDGTDDVLAQAAFRTGEADAQALYHFPYFGEGEGYRRGSAMTLSDGIKSVARDGKQLVVTVHKYRDGDAACCPTGEDVLNLQF